MSVEYKLNKKIRIGDLKKIGLKVEDINEDASNPSRVFVVTNENESGVAITSFISDGSENVDNWEVIDFEGRFSYGGGDVMLEICDKLNCLFITDEDIENCFYESCMKNLGNDVIELTDEMFENRTKHFKEVLNWEQNKN